MDRSQPLNIPEDSNLTPILRQYRELHREVPDAILFFQVGDFYETFFEDAIRISELLGITLTTRNRNDPQPVPMAGVPVLHAEGYFRRALRQGITLAICDQVGDEKSGGGPMERRITRVLTPGTALFGEGEEGLDLEPWIWVYVERGGEALLLRHNFIEGTTAYGIFPPREALAHLLASPCVELLLEEGTSPPQELRQRGVLFRFYPRVDKVQGLKEVGMAILDGFLGETQRVELKHLSPPQPLLRPDSFPLDPRSQKNLEIFTNLWNGGEEGTLFRLLNRCRTRMGSRLLKEWLRFPLLNRERIGERQAKIRFLVEQPSLLKGIRECLQGIPDLHHLVARLSQKSAGPETLQQIRKALKKGCELAALLASPSLEGEEFSRERRTLERASPILSDLETTLSPSPPRNPREGGVIAQGVDGELDELRAFLDTVHEKLRRIEEEERERTQIPSLKVGYNRVFGYYIEIPNAHRHRVPSHYYRKQTLTQAERYIIPELKALEVEIEENRERILAREMELYEKLLLRVESEIPLLKEVADALALLDVTSSLALIAREQRWVFPRLHEGFSMCIRGGKHPVLAAQGRFVPNDTLLDEARYFVLITGPNMGGKSTYLRQVALIVLLAQIGSPVPAEEAEIAIVDRLFTRIGASDALWLGRSTFMVEMEETAQLLKELTPRSLVILDEIGRGTSTYDGISIARAVSEWLIAHKVKALFATHYHELLALGELPGVQLLHPRVHIEKGEVLFLYEMREGGSPHSYGIHVARAAGVPQEVITRAEEILNELEGGAGRSPRKRQLKLFP